MTLDTALTSLVLVLRLALFLFSSVEVFTTTFDRFFPSPNGAENEPTLEENKKVPENKLTWYDEKIINIIPLTFSQTCMLARNLECII
jgi:hypothetical protein